MGLAVFWAGALLLFVLAPALAAAHRARLRAWAVASGVPALTCRELRGPAPVAVTARTSAREVVTAPVSGADCVCYWTEYRSGTYDESENRYDWLTESRHQVGRVEIEDGTGPAVVTPRLAARRLTGRRDRLVRTARRRSETSGRAEETRVWWVPPDVAVTVIGAVSGEDDVPVLDLPDPPEGAGVTSRPLAEAVARLAVRAARWNTASRVCAATGLTAVSAALTLMVLHAG
jgi:hypothetical protein